MNIVIIGKYSESYVNVCKQLLVSNQFNEFLYETSNHNHIDQWRNVNAVVDNVSVKLRFKNAECDSACEMLNILHSENVLFVLNDKKQNNDQLRNCFLGLKMANVNQLAILIDQNMSEALSIENRIRDIMISVRYEPENYTFVFGCESQTSGFRSMDLFDVLKKFDDCLKRQHYAQSSTTVVPLSIDNVELIYRTKNMASNEQKIFFELEPDRYYLHESEFSTSETMDRDGPWKSANNRILHDFCDGNVTWAISIGAKLCISGNEHAKLVNGMRYKMLRLGDATDCYLEIVETCFFLDGLVNVRLYFDKPIWFEKFNECKQLGSFYLQGDTSLFVGVFDEVIELYANPYLKRAASVFSAIRQNNLPLLKIALGSNFDFADEDLFCFVRVAIYGGYDNALGYLIDFPADKQFIVNIAKFTKRIHDETSIPVNYLVLLQAIPLNVFCDVFELKQHTRNFIEMCENLAENLDVDDSERESLANDISNMDRHFEQVFGQSSRNVARVQWLHIDYVEVLFQAILDPERHNNLVKFNFDSIKCDGIRNCWLLQKIFECDSFKCLNFMLTMNVFRHQERKVLSKIASCKKCPNILKTFECCNSKNIFTQSDTCKNLRQRLENDYIDCEIGEMIDFIKMKKTSAEDRLDALNSLSILLLCLKETIDCNFRHIIMKISKLNVLNDCQQMNLMHFFETIYYRKYYSSEAKDLAFLKKYEILKCKKVVSSSTESLTLWTLIATEDIYALSLNYTISDIVKYRDTDILSLFDNQYSAKPVLFYYRLFVRSIELRKNADTIFPLRLSSNIFNNYIKQNDILCDMFKNVNNYSAVLPF